METKRGRLRGIAKIVGNCGGNCGVSKRSPEFEIETGRAYTTSRRDAVITAGRNVLLDTEQTAGGGNPKLIGVGCGVTQ